MAAFSEGRAHASSYEFVCSDWVPPRTVANASMVVRTILLSGCCQVSDAPEFWAWVLNNNERGSFAPYFSLNTLAHIRLAALNLATSSKKSIPQFQKNESRGAKSSTFNPASTPRSTYANPSASVNASSWRALDPASLIW